MTVIRITNKATQDDIARQLSSTSRETYQGNLSESHAVGLYAKRPVFCLPQTSALHISDSSHQFIWRASECSIILKNAEHETPLKVVVFQSKVTKGSTIAQPDDM
ncbi:hypothetical protein NPIL_452091 [Nephila pilipes]|uniref:Uncharacterized protein n=1 Tax=Nephila pilipes TaxID=299642 RepID=A0A8X6QTH3_NEPPI|nr:hypothetical protein NPIL_452091 [Nephila pilipes]